MQDTRVLPSFRQLFPSFRQTLLGNPRRAATAALVLLVLMGVGAGFLARNYDATRLRLARAELVAGAADANSHPEDAVEHYRAALALDRDNPAIRRALAVELFALGRSDEAESHLIELLQLDPIDAEANLLRARIALRREAFDDAETFYQRAIYGRWNDTEPIGSAGAGTANIGTANIGNAATTGSSAAAPAVATPAVGSPQSPRIAARFELLDLLSRTGARIQARAELLRLQADLPNTPALQHELARRFMAVGDATQAAEVLQRVLKQHPSDADAAKRLTDADLALGRFREARDAASHALALDPRDHATRERVDEINEALSLDPTQRGLSPATRMRRSGELLARVLQDLQTCVAALPPDKAPTWTDLQSRAQSALTLKSTSSRETDAIDAVTDQRLAIVDELWRLRVSQCSGAATGPLAWVMEHLGR